MASLHRLILVLIAALLISKACGVRKEPEGHGETEAKHEAAHGETEGKHEAAHGEAEAEHEAGHDEGGEHEEKHGHEEGHGHEGGHEHEATRYNAIVGSPQLI